MKAAILLLALLIPTAANAHELKSSKYTFRPPKVVYVYPVVPLARPTHSPQKYDPWTTMRYNYFQYKYGNYYRSHK